MFLLFVSVFYTVPTNTRRSYKLTFSFISTNQCTCNKLISVINRNMDTCTTLYRIDNDLINYLHTPLKMI